MSDIQLIAVSVKQHQEIIAALTRGDVNDTIAAIETNHLFGMQVLLNRMGEA